MKFENISIIGLGYIGLPTAAMFASCGSNVTGVDVSPGVVETINRGEVHIVEPGLEELVKKCVEDQKLRAIDKPEPADAFLIAVPTPFKANKGTIPEPDLSYIKAACEAIAPVLRCGNLVVVESTSPVGTTAKISGWLSDLRPDLSFPNKNDNNSDISIAYCPERVLPGKVISELVSNDRIIGGLSPKCSEEAEELYKIFVHGECHVTNARTAEMVKLTENASRDVQIAFANELSVICDEQNIDVWELIELSNRHPRVNILQPGPGVGGHCIAVDPWFIVHANPHSARMIKLARIINDDKPNWVISKIKQTIKNVLLKGADKTENDISVAFYGLAFKANIDDFRESPALKIVTEIHASHPGEVIIIDPNINEQNTFGFEIVTNASAADGCDIHVMLVDHDEFRGTHAPAGKAIIDVRGVWN